MHVIDCNYHNVVHAMTLNTCTNVYNLLACYIIYKAAACLLLLCQPVYLHPAAKNTSWYPMEVLHVIVAASTLASARLLLGYCFYTCTDDNAVPLLILTKVHVHRSNVFISRDPICSICICSLVIHTVR